MPPAGFESAIRARERPQTHVLDCAATGVGPLWIIVINPDKVDRNTEIIFSLN
jgi:hypothetical protein